MLFDLYGHISEVTISVTQTPREATVKFCLNDKEWHNLRFVNPRPPQGLMEFLDGCWGIRVIDRNTEENNQLEFGRFRVELWDEDNPISEFIVDGFEQLMDELED